MGVGHATMWYLASLSCLLIILAICQMAGVAFVDLCLPWRLRPAAREYLAPALGLALLLVPVNLLGWLGHGFRGGTCLLVTATLAAVGFGWQSRQGKLRLGRHGWRLAGFAALVSFPTLGQLWQFNTFNPFNDTWTYLYQAQWLQSHGFHEPAVVTGHHAAMLSVAGFQRSGLRITPSLLLGWLQAAFGLNWSYEVYPTAVSLILLCGALGVGGIVRAAFPGRRREAWWVALAAGVTLNGFACGAAAGFYPQTVGLAFSTVALALRGMEMTWRRGGNAPLEERWTAQLREELPLAACGAAVVYCYPELLPFLLPALAASYLLPWPGSQKEARQRGITAGLTILVALLLAGTESGRAFHALKMQAQVVAGNPVAWTVGGFLAQSLGLRADIYEGGTWFYENGWSVLLVGIAPIAGFGLLLWLTDAFRPPVDRTRNARWWLAVVPATSMVGLCALAFVYFRYFVANPWPHGVGPWAPGVGQTWSQFKLSLWVSPALLAVAGVSLIRLSQAWRFPAASLVLAGWCAAGLGWNASLLLVRANPIRLVSGETHDPFGSYRAFCEPLTELPASDVIFLDATPGDFGSIKQRELLAYFLGDRPLIGNWTLDDNLPTQLLPPQERQPPAAGADWIVRYHPPVAGTVSSAIHPLCGLTASRVAHEGWTLTAVTGGYDREHLPDGNWYYWTPHALHLTWHKAAEGNDDPDVVPATPPHRMKLRFDQHSLAAAQTVTVQIKGTTAGTQTFTVVSDLENHRNESEPFVVAGNEVEVDFSGSGEARRASATDARELSYLVSSATLESVKD